MSSIFKRSIIFSALLTLVLSAMALAMPDDLSSMTATQLKNYLYAQKAAVVSKDKTSTPPFTADELITWGKEDLRSGNPSKALVFFEYALSLYPGNQVAEFYASLSLIGTNPDVAAQLQQMGLMDSQGQITYKKHQTINFPDVISFAPSQELIAEWNSNEISQAITLLNQINETFSDTITDPKLGTVKVDYAAVKAVLMGLNGISYAVHLANAYDMDYAQLTKNDLGELTTSNLTSLTSDVNTLYSQLLSNGYIGRNGTVSNLGINLLSNVQPNFVIYQNSSAGPNNYVIYSWIGTWNHRIALGSGDSCGQQTVYRYNGTVFATYTSTVDPGTGMCKSNTIVTANGPGVGGTDLYTIDMSITHNGKNYSVSHLQYYNFSTNLYFTSYYYIDPVLSAPDSAAILNLLTSIIQDKMSFLSLLNFYPTLLAHKTTTPAELLAAKNSLLAMVNSYLALESYALAQDQSEGANYVIQAYTPVKPSKHPLTQDTYEKDKLAHQAQQQAIHNFMVALKNNLTNPTQYPYVQANDPAFGDHNMLAAFKLDFASLFNPQRDVRGYTKLVEQELHVYHLFPDNFSDPTMGGILPGASAADLNFLYKQGAQLGSATITTANGTKSIFLVWGPSLFLKNGQNITGYDLYRSISPTVNAQSTLVAHLNQNLSTYSDSGINPATPVYYYRIYTHYLFPDNSTATSYSKVFKVTLIKPVAGSNPPVIFQIPDQTMNAGDTLTLLVQGTDPNQESINWNVNILTKIPNYSDTWGNCTPPNTLVNGKPISCPAGEYYIQFSPSLVNSTGVFNVTVYANDSIGGESTMSFNVNVLPILGKIQGTVINKSTKKPLAGVLISAKGSYSYSTTTNSLGQYTLNAVPVDTYSVSASLNGYVTSSDTVNMTKTNLDPTDNFSLTKS